LLGFRVRGFRVRGFSFATWVVSNVGFLENLVSWIFSGSWVWGIGVWGLRMKVAGLSSTSRDWA